MIRRVFFIVLAVSFAAAATTKRKSIKDYVNVCHASDPNLGECLRNSITQLKPKLTKGIPEFNIVPLEPLIIPRMEFKDGMNNFRFSQTLKNLKITGMSRYEITKTVMDLAKPQMNFTLFHDILNMEGENQVDGQILVLPIKGTGYATYNFTDVTTDVVTNYERYKKNNTGYLRVKSLKLVVTPRKCRIHFTNLFNGDHALGETMNKFLNDNWKEIFETYRSLPETAFATVFKSMSNEVLKLFPESELFPK